ncbi:MAG: hypothetical protein FJ109_20965 [Deltaproteobacteria bacterium]|nr:hypothetical protein [Deltaproteobacteria bacterium]
MRWSRTGITAQAAGAVLLAVLLSGGCGRGRDAAALDRLEQALNALEAGRHEVALDGCLEVSRRMPGEPSAAGCRLMSALHLGRYGQAEEAALELAALYPENGWYRAVAIEAGKRAGSRPPGEPPRDAATGWACLGTRCPAVQAGGDVPPLTRALLHVQEGDLPSAASVLAGNARPGSEAHDLHLLLMLRQREFDRLSRALAGLTCGPLARQGEVAAQAALFLLSKEFFKDGRCPTPPPGVWQAGLALAVEAFRHRSGQATAAGERGEAAAGGLPAPFWRALATPGLSQEQEAGWLEAAAQMRPDVAALQVDAAVALLRSGRAEQAAWYLKRAEALAVDPLLPRVLGVVTTLYRQDFDSASAQISALSSSLPLEWTEALAALSLDGPFPSSDRK